MTVALPRNPLRRPPGEPLSVPRNAALVISAAVLSLTACGDDGSATAEPGPTSPGTASPAAPAPGTPTQTPTDDDTGGETAGLPPRPAPGSCVDVAEAGDGRYLVYEAGSAVVTREGDRLVLGEVQAAEGWTARVDDEEADEVEIDFRRDGTDVLDLEVEIDDGRVEVQICADDD